MILRPLAADGVFFPFLWTFLVRHTIVNCFSAVISFRVGIKELSPVEQQDKVEHKRNASRPLQPQMRAEYICPGQIRGKCTGVQSK